jgi:hypothetical protein
MRPLSPKTVLLLILALFILPLAIAWMMHTGTIRFTPDHTRNSGQLVIPTVPLEWSDVIATGNSPSNRLFDGFWVILYELPASCTRHCLEAAAGLRQVHIASGLHRNRIKIALLLAPKQAESLSHELLGIYSGFHLVSHPSQGFTAALRHASNNRFTRDDEPVMYLVDPLGNIMMTYNGEDSPSMLSKDLKRLLTWSKLDKRS